MDTEEPVRFRGSEGQPLRGVPAALFLLALLLGLTSIALKGDAFLVAAVAIAAGVGVFWWKILVPKTQVEIRGTRYTLTIGKTAPATIDLREASNIKWRYIPYGGAFVQIIGSRGVLLDLPVSRARRRELHALGQALAESHPGRVYMDRRAARALGMK